MNKSIEKANSNGLKIHLLSYLLLLSFFLFMFSSHFIEEEPVLTILSLDNIRYIIYPIFFIGLMVQIILGQTVEKKVLNFILLMLFLVIVFQSITSKINISILVWFALFFVFLFITEIEYRFPLIEKIFLGLSILFSIFYGYSQGFIGPDGRFVANSDDPNITALFFLFGFYFAYRRNYKFFKYCFLILGILTFSRNFVGAIAFFYLIKYLKFKKYGLLLLQKIPIWLAFLLFNIVVMAVGNIMLLNSKENFVLSTNTSSRFLHWKDTSNKRRLVYNQLALYYSLKDREGWFKGYGQNYNLRNDIYMPKHAHNSLLDLTLSFGVVNALVMIIVLSTVFKRVTNITNYEYLYSYLFFSSFLPGCLGSNFVYAFYAILCLRQPLKNSINDKN